MTKFNKSEYMKEYRRKTREQRRIKDAEYRNANRKLIQDSNNRYYHANKSKISEHRKDYVKSNRASYNRRNATRRATQLNATPKWLTADHLKQIELIYDNAQLSSMHVDHIVPLNHPMVCGLHVPWNLQLLTPEDNISKRNNFNDWD